MHRTRIVLLAGLLALGGWQQSASAADDITIGKAVPTSFAFTTADVGQAAGIWKSEGLNLQIMSFRGDAVLQQALTSGSVDFGLGSGPALGFHVKGADATAVAVIAGAPDNMGLCLPVDSSIHSLQDLKGRRIGITTVGSLTDWLVRELSRRQGWGSDGIHALAIGPSTASVAATKAGNVDGFVGELAGCLQLQQEGRYRLALNFGDQIKDFYTHVLFARNDLITQKPDLVRRTLRAWFKTVAYMRAHKDQAIGPVQQIMGLSPQVASQTYDVEMPMMSSDGAFDAKTLQTVAESLQELDILPTVPPITAQYDGRFVPVKLE